MKVEKYFSDAISFIVISIGSFSIQLEWGRFIKLGIYNSEREKWLELFDSRWFKF